MKRIEPIIPDMPNNRKPKVVKIDICILLLRCPTAWVVDRRGRCLRAEKLEARNMLARSVAKMYMLFCVAIFRDTLLLSDSLHELYQPHHQRYNHSILHAPLCWAWRFA